MGAYKDKGGRWYVSVRYRNWLGEPSRKTKRGFTTKRDALAWEREFLQKYSGSLDMTFNSFYEVYQNDLQNRIRQNTWVTKSSIIEKKILPYFGDKRVRDVKPVDVLHWQNIIMETTDENGMYHKIVGKTNRYRIQFLRMYFTIGKAKKPEGCPSNRSPTAPFAFFLIVSS